MRTIAIGLELFFNFAGIKNILIPFGLYTLSSRSILRFMSPTATTARPSMGGWVWPAGR